MKLRVLCECQRNAIIKPEGDKFCLYSKDGKKLGTFDTRAEAEAREKQINMFKARGARGFKANAKKKDPKEVMYQSRKHLVVPVTALVEGVIHASNSENPELVLAEEFEKNVHTWNGRPIMLNHPKVGGESVSAGNPEILDAYQIGTVFGAHVEGRELLMDAYLDIEKMEKMGGEAAKMLASINAGEEIEVSVGTFVDAEMRSGRLGDKTFNAVWRNIATDHLAFLPEGLQGACSIEMGCGARAASAVVLTYDSSAASCGCGGPKPNNASAGDVKMDKKKLVAALIASGKFVFKTADAAVLETLPDETLKALEVEMNKPVEPPKVDEKKLETEEEFLARNPEIKGIVDAAKANAKLTPEQQQEAFLKANPVIGDIVSQHKAARASRTAELIGQLKTAQKAYTEDELKALPLETLEKLALISVTPKKDFSGAGPARAASGGEREEAPKPIDMKARILERAKQKAS